MKLTPKEFEEQIRLAIKGGHAIVFKNFFEGIGPEWDEVLLGISNGYHDDDWNDRPSGYPATEPAVGSLTVRGRFYITIRLDHEASALPSMAPGLEFLREAMPIMVHPSHAITSLVRAEPNTETTIHSDNVHTFYWQLQGSSIWHLYKERCCVHCSMTNNSVSSITVNKGDLLFSPRDMIHTIQVTEPRAAAVFRFGHDDDATFYERGELNPREVIQK